MVSLLFILIAHASAATSIVDLITQANQEATRGTSAGCNLQDTGPTELAPPECLEIERTTIEDVNGQTLPISVISDQRLDSLKAVYYDDVLIYNPKVCAQRAHTIGADLAKAGIETVKLYVQPGGIWPFKGHIIPDRRACAKNPGSNRCFTPHWEYHVVNMIKVQTDAGIVDYIIDPFMESMPVPREKWEKRIRENPNSSISSMDVISRFNFGPGDAGKTLTDYNPEIMAAARRIMTGDLGPLQ